MSDSDHRKNRPLITQNNPHNHKALSISVTEQTEQNREYRFIEENTLHLKGKNTMKRQLIYALTLTATLAASVIPASANPIAPSNRGSNDSRGMCNDVYVGQNTQNNIQQRNNIVEYSQNNNGTSSNAWNYMNSSSGYKRQSASGGGGFSFLGIGASGGGGSASASGFSNYNANRGSNSSSFNRDYRYGHDKSTFSDTSSSTAVVGQDCTAVVQSRTAITQQLIGW